MASIARNGRGLVTEKEVDKLKLPEGKSQEFFWHPDLPGFGIRVGKSAKTYMVQGRVSVNGRKRLRKIDIGRTDLFSLSDAMMSGREMLGMLASGIDPKKAKEAEAGRISTLRGMLERARQGKGSGYGRTVDQYMGDLLDVGLLELDAGRIESRYRAIIQEVAARKHGPSARSASPGVATANGVLRALSAVWNYVETLEGERHSIPPNPVPKLARVNATVKTPVKKDRIPADKLGEFWKVLSEEKFIVGRDAIAVMLLTGLRRQAVCAMRVGEWDSADKMLRFGVGRMKGKTGDVVIPVSKEVAAILDRRAAIGVGKYGVGGGKWMFPSSGKGGYLAEPRSVLDRVCGKLDVICNVHGLRRTFASEAAFCMGEIQRKSLMVHAMSGVTQEVYTEIAGEDLRGPAQLVGDRLMGYTDIGSKRAVIDGLAPYGVTSTDERSFHMTSLRAEAELEEASRLTLEEVSGSK